MHVSPPRPSPLPVAVAYSLGTRRLTPRRRKLPARVIELACLTLFLALLLSLGVFVGQAMGFHAL